MRCSARQSAKCDRRCAPRHPRGPVLCRAAHRRGPRLCYAASMQPLATLEHWMDRVRDRERVGTFARFLARRFLDDRLFQAAAALAYATIFALVPLAIVVLGVLSAFP